MQKPKYNRRSRVYYSTIGKNATVVASDTTRAFNIIYYIIRVDGEKKDRYNIPESSLENER